MLDSKGLAWLIRRHGIEMTHLSGGSHVGPILSVADIIAVLYSGVANVDATNPKMENRDKVILSKGHAGASIYSALAERGFFPVEVLKTHYQNGSMLSGHVSHHVPGVEISTGSLGHGLSVGAGMAYAKKKSGKSEKVYVVLGDGECDEGAVWECALFANHNELNNLCAIVDHNKMQSMDYCEKTMKFNSLVDKWKAFGWEVFDIDGHDHQALKKAMLTKTKGPKVIIANTIKGKGVSFMENNILWHYRFPHNGWEYEQAVCELHKIKPKNVVDPYTPNGIENPTPIPKDAGAFSDYTTTATWKPTWNKGGAR